MHKILLADIPFPEDARVLQVGGGTVVGIDMAPVLLDRAHEMADKLTMVGRGADLLRAAGRLGEEEAATLKAEARRRVEAGSERHDGLRTQNDRRYRGDGPSGCCRGSPLAPGRLARPRAYSERRRRAGDVDLDTSRTRAIHLDALTVGGWLSKQNAAE
jgi:hypothetical protein